MLKLKFQYFGHLMSRADSLEKILVLGKIEGRSRGGHHFSYEDEMAGWRHLFNGRELGQTPGGGEGQGSLACCSPWGRKESDMTWRLNNNNNSWVDLFLLKNQKGSKQLGCRMKLGLQRKHPQTATVGRSHHFPGWRGTEAAKEHSLMHKRPSCLSQHLLLFYTTRALQHMTSNKLAFSLTPSPKKQKREGEWDSKNLFMPFWWVLLN